MTGGAEPFDTASVLVDGEARALSSLPLVGTYAHPPLPDDEDAAEYVVPVSWHQSRPRENAVWAKGMFANQNSACKIPPEVTVADDILRFADDPRHRKADLRAKLTHDAAVRMQKR